MKKIIGVVVVGLIVFNGFFIGSVKANDDWSFENDENNFKVITSSATLDYRIMILDKDNCDNIDGSVSFDNNGDFKTISKNSSTSIYNVPYIKNYNGDKCQVIIVRNNVNGVYTHKYYARVVTGTGEVVTTPTPSPKPTVKPTPTAKPKQESKSEKQDDVMPIKDSKEKDSTPTYGIVILGGVVILGVVIFKLKGKKRKSINY